MEDYVNLPESPRVTVFTVNLDLDSFFVVWSNTYSDTAGCRW